MDTALPIKGWPGFFITSDGYVVGPKGEKAQSTMKAYGYKYVTFWRDGKAHKQLVHRLVASHFIGEIPKGMQVCHGPEGRVVNNVKNLRIGTPKSNAADKIRDGTLLEGVDMYNSRFTEDQVRFIRSCKGLYRGVQRELSKQFKVSESMISNIMRDKTYTNT